MAINIPEETRQDLINSIRNYFRTERADEIGDLQASLLLDFVAEEIGPTIYNQALKDAQASLSRAVADLDVNLHESELGYSHDRRRRKNRES